MSDSASLNAVVRLLLTLLQPEEVLVASNPHEDIDLLRGAMDGPVIGPADADYDDVRKVMNAAIDRRPAVIARCLNATDVRAAINFAREQRLEVSVRGGAHSTAGHGVCDDGLMIDLSQIRDVRVDPQNARVRVGGGALLADMDAATQAHGLAVPAGVVSHTGVGGLTLGGGMGWLTRKHGLTVDNLLSAEIVTADGQILRAAPQEHAELFWAIRGGGGNFGVITAFEFQAHKVGPLVQFGLFFWGLERGVDVLRLAQDVLDSLPREVTAIIAGLSAPPAPFVPAEYHFQPGYALLLVGFGSPEEHAAVAERIRGRLPPLFEFVTPMPYAALQQFLDEGGAWGLFSYEKGIQISRISDEAIEAITTHLSQRTSPTSVLLLYPLTGAYSEVDEDATAFGGGRSPRLDVTINAAATDPEALAADRAWVRSFWSALQPHAISVGGYVNEMTEYEEDRVKASYGPVKYDRLARIKAIYDPENMFHRNANIKPATTPG
jgi:FAD/FMN-containing dehydrogenase